MGRKGIEVESLYGLSTEELKKMRNSHEDEFARSILTAVIMRYEGVSTIKISQFLLKSKQTIIDYIKRWNSRGLKALACNRGGSEGTFTAEMLENLINTVLNTRPNDFGFIGNVWTCPLLAESHREKLFLINTPRYSPELNPQENIWNKLKNCIFNTSAISLSIFNPFSMWLLVSLFNS